MGVDPPKHAFAPGLPLLMPGAWHPTPSTLSQHTRHALEPSWTLQGYLADKKPQPPRILQ